MPVKSSARIAMALIDYRLSRRRTMIPMAISDPSSAKSKASVMRVEILGTKRLSSLASKRKALEGVFELNPIGFSLLR